MQFYMLTSPIQYTRQHIVYYAPSTFWKGQFCSTTQNSLCQASSIIEKEFFVGVCYNMQVSLPQTTDPDSSQIANLSLFPDLQSFPVKTENKMQPNISLLLTYRCNFGSVK